LPSRLLRAFAVPLFVILALSGAAGAGPPNENDLPSKSEEGHKTKRTTVVLPWLAAIGAIIAAIGAVAAAIFTFWQAWVASDAEERQLRAYLYVGSASDDLERNTDGSFTFAVTPKQKIFGMTPAARVRPSWNLLIMTASPPGQLPPFVSIPGRSSVNLVEVPGQEYSLGSTSVNISKQDADALQKKTKLLVI